MNWEQLFNALKDLMDDDGKMPEEFSGQVVVANDDGRFEVELSQSLINGSLVLIPVVE